MPADIIDFEEWAKRKSYITRAQNRPDWWDDELEQMDWSFFSFKAPLTEEEEFLNMIKSKKFMSEYLEYVSIMRFYKERDPLRDIKQYESWLKEKLCTG